jgi:sodium/potassium-transporting ATPase subunit alpha
MLILFQLLRLPVANSSDRPAPISPQDNFNSSDLMLLVKGAPDVLLKRCTHTINPLGGSPLPLDSSTLARLTAIQEKWAAKGQRVLLLAKRHIPSSLIDKAPAFDHPDFATLVDMELNHGLTVVGLVGLVDPPREDIPETVRIMRGAGIRFFMVTGDFALTAVAIAEQCGIISDASKIHKLKDLDRDLDINLVHKYDTHKIMAESSQEEGHEYEAKYTTSSTQSLVLSGPDLMEMNESQWHQACQYTEIVFARTTPEQKLRIVKEFQARECVVGMTGDGVNDAPSLKAADVGIAMGGGSDVAMEAADLILLET